MRVQKEMNNSTDKNGRDKEMEKQGVEEKTGGKMTEADRFGRSVKENRGGTLASRPQ